MSDDFSSLAPTDPTTLGPEWAATRRKILDGVLVEDAPRRSHAGRWVAGLAAAALTMVAVGGVIQQLRPEPYAVPASPSPTQSTGGDERVVAASDTLVDTGTGIFMCSGHVTDSLPPTCSSGTPVTGITWEDVPWATTDAGTTFAEEAVVVGSFEADVFAATRVLRRGDPAAPQPPERSTEQDIPALCDDPIRGTGENAFDPLMATAEALPGFQALWLSPNQTTYNVAVTKDVVAARKALATAFGGEFCVGTVKGPTHEALQTAEQSLQSLMIDPSDPSTIADSIWERSLAVTALGNRLEVTVRRDTTELLDSIKDAVGPEIWPFIDVVPFFYPVLDGPTPVPTSNAPAPTPSTMPQVDGKYIARGGVEYRDGVVSLCYSIAYAAMNSCRAAIPLLGVDPQNISWERGSSLAGSAFAYDVVIVGTMEGNGIRVSRSGGDFPGESGIEGVSTAEDPAFLASAAAEFVSSYGADPFAPTAEVQETDPEGARLIVHVLVDTDEAVAQVRQRLGEDIWQYTYVEPLISPYQS